MAFFYLVNTCKITWKHLLGVAGLGVGFVLVDGKGNFLLKMLGWIILQVGLLDITDPMIPM